MIILSCLSSSPNLVNRVIFLIVYLYVAEHILKLIQLIDFKVYSFLTSYKRKVTLHLKILSNLFFFTCLFCSTIILSRCITFIKSSITLSSHVFQLDKVNVYFNHFAVIFPYFSCWKTYYPDHCQDELIAIFLGFACSKIWVLIFG